MRSVRYPSDQQCWENEAAHRLSNSLPYLSRRHAPGWAISLREAAKQGGCSSEDGTEPTLWDLDRIVAQVDSGVIDKLIRLEPPRGDDGSKPGERDNRKTPDVNARRKPSRRQMTRFTTRAFQEGARLFEFRPSGYCPNASRVWIRIRNTPRNTGMPHELVASSLGTFRSAAELSSSRSASAARCSGADVEAQEVHRSGRWPTRRSRI